MPQITSHTIQAHAVRFNLELNRYEMLILKRSPSARLYADTWQVVTGRVEHGETAFAAALRELKEETSFVPLKAWTVPYVASYFVTGKDEIGMAPVFAFLVDYHAEVVLSDEHSQCLWIEFDEIEKYVPIPSHSEATKVFEKFVLNGIEQDLYTIPKELF